MTLGLGIGWAKADQDPTRFLDGPIIGIGFHERLGKHTALVSESWIITGEGVEFGQQPFGLALRFFSDRLAVDLGVILDGNALSRGFPGFPLPFTSGLNRALSHGSSPESPVPVSRSAST